MRAVELRKRLKFKERKEETGKRRFYPVNQMENKNERNAEETKELLKGEALEYGAEEDCYGCDILTVPRELIRTSSDNQLCGYEVENDISELAYSIRQFGLGQPLNVLPEEDGTYWVAGGNRRLKALKYGDSQGWGWFKEGYPCVISKSAHSKEDNLDRRIWIHELNIHNRSNEAHFYEHVQQLLDLYRQKEEKNGKKKETGHYSTKIIEMLSEKLGVGIRQGKTIAYIAENAPDWLRKASAAGMLPKDSAYTIGHMPNEFQQELQAYFNKHGNIPKDLLDRYVEKKFIMYDAPDWLREAVKKSIISEVLARKIAYSTLDSKKKLQDYYERHKKLPPEIISEFLVDKKGSTMTVREIKDMETKARAEEVINSVTSGRVSLKQYKDPLEFDLEDADPADIPASFGYGNEHFSKHVDNCGDYPDEGLGDDLDDEDFTVPEAYGDDSTGYYDSEFEENCQQEMIYDGQGYENTSYPDDMISYGEEDDIDADDLHENVSHFAPEIENVPTVPMGVIDGFDENQSDDVLKSTEEKGVQNKKKETDAATLQRMMSDSLWWFNNMAEKGKMNEEESIYVDMMFHLMKLFYFPRIVRLLEQKKLPEMLKETLKVFVEMVIPFI